MPIEIKKPEKIGVIKSNIAGLSDFEVRALLAQILKEQDEQDKSLEASQELKEIKESVERGEADVEKIRRIFEIFQNHPTMLKEDGSRRANLDPEGVFAKYLVTFIGVASESLVSSLLKYLNILQKITLIENKEQRNSVLEFFPPTDQEELLCIGGTGSRFEEITRRYLSSPEKVVFLEACNKVYLRFLNEYRYFFSVSNEIHFPRYLDHVLGLRSEELIKKTDEYYGLMRKNIPSQYLVEIFENFSQYQKLEICKEIERNFEYVKEEIIKIFDDIETKHRVDLSRPFDAILNGDLVHELSGKLKELAIQYGLKNEGLISVDDDNEEIELYQVNPEFIAELVEQKLSLRLIDEKIVAAKFSSTNREPLEVNSEELFSEQFGREILAKIGDKDPQVCARYLEILWAFGNKCFGNSQIHFCRIFDQIYRKEEGDVRILDEEIESKIIALPELIAQNLREKISYMKERFDAFYEKYLEYEEKRLVLKESMLRMREIGGVAMDFFAARNFYSSSYDSTEKSTEEVADYLYSLFSISSLATQFTPSFFDYCGVQESRAQVILRPDARNIFRLVARESRKKGVDISTDQQNAININLKVHILDCLSIAFAMGKLDLYQEIKKEFGVEIEKQVLAATFLATMMEKENTKIDFLIYEEQILGDPYIISASHNFVYNGLNYSGNFINVAAASNNLVVLIILLESGVDVNLTDPISQKTPLCIAAEAGNTAVARFLIENGADLNAKAWGKSLLWAAINSSSASRLRMLEMFLDLGLDVNLVEADSQKTSLWIAVEKGDVEAAKILIARGADLNFRFEEKSLLFAARKSNSVNMMQYLIENHLINPNAPVGSLINMNYPKDEEEDILYKAIRDGQSEMALLILDYERFVNIAMKERNEKGEEEEDEESIDRMFKNAVLKCNKDLVIKMLDLGIFNIKFGEDKELGSEDIAEVMMHVIRRFSDEEATEILIKIIEKIPPSQLELIKNTHFDEMIGEFAEEISGELNFLTYSCAFYNKLEALKLLLHYEFAQNDKNPKKSAIMGAVEQDRCEIFLFLMRNIKQIQKRNYIPCLIYACESAQYEAIEQMLGENFLHKASRDHIEDMLFKIVVTIEPEEDGYDEKDEKLSRIIKIILSQKPDYAPSFSLMEELSRKNLALSFGILLEKFDLELKDEETAENILHSLASVDNAKILEEFIQTKQSFLQELLSQKDSFGYCPANVAAAKEKSDTLSALLLINQENVFCDAIDVFVYNKEGQQDQEGLSEDEKEDRELEKDDIINSVYFLTKTFLDLSSCEFSEKIFRKIFAAIEMQKELILDKAEDRVKNLQESLVGKIYDFVEALPTSKAKKAQIDIFLKVLEQVGANLSSEFCANKIEEIKALANYQEKEEGLSDEYVSRKKGKREEIERKALERVSQAEADNFDLGEGQAANFEAMADIDAMDVGGESRKRKSERDQPSSAVEDPMEDSLVMTKKSRTRGFGK